MVKDMRKSRTLTTSRFGAASPDEMKELVRCGMMRMAIKEREEFTASLADELRRENITMSAYLVPLGIPGRSPADLTPTEVGHLVRFLRINVPQSIRAVERALTRYAAFAEKVPGGNRLAA
jgi:hypothetical protein